MEKIAPLLKQIPVVLASSSPRRIKMLRDFGLDPIVVKPDCGEEIFTELLPHQLVMALSLRKNLAVSGMSETELLMKDADDYLVISSDTIVSFNGQVLEKPVDEADAVRMLSMLSGNAHTVFTGCCVYHKATGNRLLFYDSTDVCFKPYGRDVIDAYVATGIPMDKAGSYGIQDGFRDQVDHFIGSEDTVIGFPLNELLTK